MISYFRDDGFRGSDCSWQSCHEEEYQRLLKQMARAGDDYLMIGVYLSAGEQDRLLAYEKRRIRPEVVAAPIETLCSANGKVWVWEIQLGKLRFSKQLSGEHLRQLSDGGLAEEFSIRCALRERLENALRKREGRVLL